MADRVDSLFDLTGRVAVVTGAGANGGLGHAMAVGLARYGADIVVSDIDEPGANKTTEEVRALGRLSIAVRCDISKPDEVTKLFAELDRAFGHIEVLINNPFASSRSRPEDLSLEDWQRVLGVNLTGFFLCAQEAGRRMIRQRTGGSIINIGSIAGCLALGRGNFVYSITKGAIHQMTRELAVEWAEHRIRVNALVPCQMRTPAVRKWLGDSPPADSPLVNRLLAGIPMSRFGEPEDVVGPAVFLASDASAFVTGILLPVDGGNLALNAGGSTRWPTG
ncbi:MAG: SDR family oxidoreductase [Anaerolineae bacterium]|nr:SDR family oxidoreductase [Anaerolineae bacterium]